MSETASTCPIPLTGFPPTVQRNLDPKSPIPMRMMAAKGILVCPPRDFLGALFVLTFDPDPKIAETAAATATAAPEKVLSGLRDEQLDSQVLGFYANVLANNDKAQEFIALNPNTSDETLAAIAGVCDERIVEIISQNQLRILRDDRIVRAIVANPKTRKSTRDPLLDFCVRSGLHMPDLPEYMEARVRILGADPVAAKEIVEQEKITAEAVVEEFGDAVVAEDKPVEEEKKQTFTQRVMKMSVSQKIKFAAMGNKEARTILLRDSNKLVCLAAVSSPRMTDGEVLALANNRTLNDEVMRFIVRNSEWLKIYQMKVNLVNNPKCPLPVAMKLLQMLHPSEVKSVAKNKNCPTVLQNQARAMIAKAAQASGGGGGGH